VGQGSLGDRSFKGFKGQKGGVAMVKRVHIKSGMHKNTALVALGWLAFILGMLMPAKQIVLSACLMAVARVLP